MFDYMKIRITGFVWLLMLVAAACKKDNDRSPLVAAIEGEQFEVLAGDSITFRDVSQGQAARWKWTFEGGAPETSELSSPTVVYIKPGKYKVTLEISNSSQTSTVTKEDFISVGYNQINVNFEADKLVGVDGETIQFTDRTTGIPDTWNWEFIHETQGILYTSTEKNPAIKFEVIGKYSVKLKASNPGYSGEKTINDYIVITSMQADFTASTTATYTGGSINFEDVSLGNVENRTWTFEGGNPATSTDQKPAVTYSTPGRYKVKLAISNATRSSEKEIEQYILVVPGDGLAAFLPFNKVVTDIGPLAMGVTLQGNPVFTETDRNNVVGNAVLFNGSSGVLLQSQGILNLGTGDYSVAGWVKAGTAARMVWQESGKNGSGDNQSWLRMNDNTTDRQLRFNTEEPGGSSILNMGNEGKMSDNTWKHFVCVRKGTNMSVYINGVKVKELNTPAVRNVTGAQNFKIGMQEGVSSFTNFFNGLMDDFLIYKKALTQAEITALYQL
jgi:PKD repeat protein